MTLGFWVNIHPGFASPRSVLEEIKQDISENYSTNPEIITTFDLPATYTPADNYLARGRVSGKYHDTTPGHPASPLVIDADALLMYSSSDDFDRSLILLT
jgi:hypothetical protein